MPQQIKLSENESKTIAKLINNISIAGSQVMQRDRPNLWHKACANLQEVQKSHKPLLESLNELGRTLNEEIITSLIETLDKRPDDATGMLSLTRRCLNASAFLAHCLATGEITSGTSNPIGKPESPISVH
jgi:hypothetical protein